MTFMFGSCESVPIRLSVRPSLKYSLLESLVALTKGNTAMESTLPAVVPRKKYQPQAIAITTTAASAGQRYLRRALVAIGAAAGAAELDDNALAGTAALCERPESRSRFRRARSVRRSAAF